MRDERESPSNSALITAAVICGTGAGLVAWLGLAGLIAPYVGPRFPLGYVTLLAAVAFGFLAGRVWYRRKQQRIRVYLGMECPTCGYDLRATTARCPECGEFIPLPLEGRDGK